MTAVLRGVLLLAESIVVAGYDLSDSGILFGYVVNVATTML